MMEESNVFEDNGVYRISQFFECHGNRFEANEELTYKGCKFDRFEEAWYYAFKDDAGKSKFLVIYEEKELAAYAKYFSRA